MSRHEFEVGDQVEFVIDIGPPIGTRGEVTDLWDSHEWVQVRVNQIDSWTKSSWIKSISVVDRLAELA